MEPRFAESIVETPIAVTEKVTNDAKEEGPINSPELNVPGLSMIVDEGSVNETEIVTETEHEQNLKGELPIPSKCV